MIKEITTNKNGDRLTVQVVCRIRDFATHVIKELTTEQVIDKVSKDFTIEETLQVPKKIIGNTNRKKMSNVGTWVFKIKEEAAIEKPKTATPKSKSKPKQSSTPTESKTSIRSRMSKLATKPKED